MTTDDERELNAILRDADEGQLAAIVEELRKEGMGAEKFGQCNLCDYVAIGNSLEEILSDMGRHCFKEHPDLYWQVNDVPLESEEDDTEE
jgi:hypothetical protein